MNAEMKLQEPKERKFMLHLHPWLAMVAVIITTVVSNLLAGTVIFGLLDLPEYKPWVQFIQGMAYHFLNIFIFFPFLLQLPRGKRKFSLYLNDIGLTRLRPFLILVLLGLSSYLILALAQVGGSIVYRIFEGFPISWNFIISQFNISGDLPPASNSLLISIPSIFEEVAFRGVVLSTFLNKYSKSKSIIYSSLGFGLIHFLNLFMGREPIWVLGQVVWAFCIGLFYGYVFVKTRSLLPSMIVHYLGNAFLGSLTAYLQSRASIEMQALFGVIFSLGIVPTALMILWARFFIDRWISEGKAMITDQSLAAEAKA